MFGVILVIARPRSLCMIYLFLFLVFIRTRVLNAASAWKLVVNGRMTFSIAILAK